MTCHLLRVDVFTGEYVRLNIKIYFSNLLHHAFCKSRFIFCDWRASEDCKQAVNNAEN